MGSLGFKKGFVIWTLFDAIEELAIGDVATLP